MSQSEKKAASRKRILCGARQVFFREGFVLTNLDEVAEIAGVAKGTIYRYFENKADLYVAVLMRDSSDFLAGLEKAASIEASSAERIRAIGDYYFEHWVRNPDYFEIFWAIDNESITGPLPTRAIDTVEDFWRRGLRVTDGVIRDGVATGEFVPCDTWAVALMLWSIADSLIASDQVVTRRKIRRRPLQRVYTDAIDIVLRAVSSGPRQLSHTSREQCCTPPVPM